MSGWETGELVAYRLKSGLWTVFRMTGGKPYEDAMCPVFEVLDWTGQNVPPGEMLRMLPVRKGKPREHPFGEEHDLVFAAPADRFMIVGQDGAPEDRVRRLGVRSAVSCSEFGPALAFWASLDETLMEEWGLE